MRYKWAWLLIVVFIASFSYTWIMHRDLYNVAWDMDNVYDFTLFDYNADGLDDIVILKYEEITDKKILHIFNNSQKILYEESFMTSNVSLKKEDFNRDGNDELLISEADSDSLPSRFVIFEGNGRKEFKREDLNRYLANMKKGEFYIVDTKSPQPQNVTKHVYSGKVEVMDAEGTLLWEKEFNFNILDTKLSDLDGDGIEEIVIVGYWIETPRVVNGFFIYDRNGEEKWHFSHWGGGVLEIDDVNNDGNTELIFGAGNPYDEGEVFCFSNDGEVLWKNKVNTAVKKIIYSQFNKRDVIIVITGDYGSAMYVFDTRGELIMKKEMPQKRWGENDEYIESDPFNVINDFLIIDVDDDGKNEVVISQNYLKTVDMEGKTKDISKKFCMCNVLMSSDLDGDGDIDVVALDYGLIVFSNSTHLGKLDWLSYRYDSSKKIFNILVYAICAFLVALPFIEYSWLTHKYDNLKYLIFILFFGVSSIIYGIGRLLHFLIFSFTFDEFSYHVYGIGYLLALIRDYIPFLLFILFFVSIGIFLLIITLISFIIVRCTSVSERKAY